MAETSKTDGDNNVLQKLMERPLQLIEPNEIGEMELNLATADLLRKLDTPVVVIAIVGVYRAGKSYLMNLLAEEKTGFDLGSTVVGKTKGIWIWCKPHPKLENTTLILMDTEGLEDTETGNTNRDMQIIILTLLLSSTLIYNASQRLDNTLIKNLEYVIQASKQIQVESGQMENRDVDFDYYFPTLVVTVRDFYLKLQIDNQNVSAQEYFDRCLRLQRDEDGNDVISAYNEPRMKILKYFPQNKRYCFVLPKPVKNYGEEALANLENLPEDQLNPKFTEKCEEYRKFILDTSEVKRFPKCKHVNGRMFADMAEEYVMAFLTGQMPCIESVFKLTAGQENDRVLRECLRDYDIEMNQLDLPMPENMLLSIHSKIVTDVVEKYQSKIIFEGVENFRKEFESKVESSYKTVIELNNEICNQQNHRLLEILYENIETNLHDDVYFKPDGYSDYTKDLDEFKENYKSNINGIISEKSLQEFLDEKEIVRDLIIKMDKKMTTAKIKEEFEEKLRKEMELREQHQQEEAEEAKIREEILIKDFQANQMSLAREFEEQYRQQQRQHTDVLRERENTNQRISRELNRKVIRLSEQVEASQRPRSRSPSNAFQENGDFVEILPNDGLMETPLKFIEWTPNGDLQLNQETAHLLDKLETPIVVVGIAGSYRSGKSYLMNLLAGKKTGFELGSTVESHTKGIWIWCRPHPILEDTTLILMDTEGLDDVNTGDDNRDMQIIVLTLLLSSSFIYNTTGRVDNNLIKQLGFVSELTNYIQVKSAPSDQIPNDTDFDFYFPALVVTVRDFVLELQIAGENVCASDYFEHCLTLKEEKKGKGKVVDFNEPRIKIRKYFPKSKRHCFVLPQPVKNFCTEVLKRLSFLSIDEMNPEFLKRSAEYQNSILTLSRLKSFGQFDKVNGRMFVDMAAAYVTALMCGQMPCIQSALKLTAQNENKRILEECLEKYDIQMIQLNFPLSQEELRDAHEATVDEITKGYKEKIIFEEANDFQDELKNKVVAAFDRVVLLNENSSREKCEAILKHLNGVIEQKMMEKFYLSPGGYDLYMTDVNELKKKYNAMQRRGVKSEQVLFEFILKKEPEINNIIAIDREMTAVKVKEEGEKRLREEIELREKMLRDEVEEAKKREEVMHKTMVETRKEMETEFEKRLAQQRDEYEQFMLERQKTQEDITSELRTEIESLKANAFQENDDIVEILPNDGLMETPLKFIEWTPNGDMQLNQETARLLHKLKTHIVVVGIAGSYRTGKSYLMNLLAGKKIGFELGSTVESQTKGIWILCLPHPILENTTLILMDTEGLDDAEAGNDNRDMQIIVLALLLSSSFIYNTTGKVDNNLIKQLGFLSELTNYIHVKSASSEETDPDDSDLDLYLPTLVVTVRDFVLKLQIRGENVSANYYFENCLTLKKEMKENSKIAEFNEPRIKIQKYFPKSKRHCFVLPQPVKNYCAEDLSKLSLLSIDEMNPEFLKQSAEYQNWILDISQHKCFGTLDKANGRIFVDMAAAYVNALMSGQMPCIQSALRLTAQNENRRILEECLENYDKQMAKLNFPLSLEELRNAHEAIANEIIIAYKKKIIFEEAADFRDDLKNKVEDAFNRAVVLNEISSRETCEKILKNLNAVIEQKMTRSAYLCPGGYNLYTTDIVELKKNYNSANRKGVNSEQILQEFLQKKESEMNNIIAIDKEMTAVKVRQEAETRQREEMALRAKMLREQVEEAKKREIAVQKTLEEARNKMNEEMRLREEERKKNEAYKLERQKIDAENQQRTQAAIADLNNRLLHAQQQSSGGGDCVIL
uniref:GB1/RHD3-type G domain-containing protein n=1 Tax=Strigamia maritima TaxID=126957 RepID=T1J4H2_STRMM